jgi:hypothetical protein
MTLFVTQAGRFYQNWNLCVKRNSHRVVYQRWNSLGKSAVTAAFSLETWPVPYLGFTESFACCSAKFSISNGRRRQSPPVVCRSPRVSGWVTNRSLGDGNLRCVFSHRLCSQRHTRFVRQFPHRSRLSVPWAPRLLGAPRFRSPSARTTTKRNTT